MIQRLSMLAALLAAIVLTGCGGDSDSTSTSDVVVTPSKCPPGSSGSAANWGGSTAGISCEAAGKLILRTFIPAIDASGGVPSTRRDVKEGEPGTINVDGYQCDHKPIPSGSGWAVTCHGEGALIAFNLTP